jgi:hypothetical protein
MAIDDINRGGPSGLLALDQDELYRLLVPPSMMDLYSVGGALARGRARFAAPSGGMRRAVCDAYRRRDDAASNENRRSLRIGSRTPMGPDPSRLYLGLIGPGKVPGSGVQKTSTATVRSST